MSANVLLTESLGVELHSDPWPEDVTLYQTFNDEQILLPDNVCSLAVQAYLHMVGLDFVVRERSNAESMSPTGRIPFIKAGEFVVAEMDHIISFVNSKGISLVRDLDDNQRSDMRAYMSLVNNVLGNAELYLVWRDEVTLNSITKPRFGSVYPWPLDVILTYQKKNQVLKKLKVLGWAEKSLEEVYIEVEDTCKSLSERLDNGPYFFGSRPTELDALVYGHLFALYTTPLADTRLQTIVGQFKNLVRLIEKVDRIYFEKQNSSDSENGTFEKLP